MAAGSGRPADRGDAPPPTVSADTVRSAAVRLRVPPRLRRLTAEGLLAAPCGAGRGRGRGREFWYPARALDQLGAIAEAMQHCHRYVALRHRVWWSPSAQLENWELWRRDRLRELTPQVMAWEMPPAPASGELPPEREQHIVEVAEGLRASRLAGLPRRQRQTLADTQTYVRLFTSVLLGDDMVDLDPGRPSPPWAQQIQALAAQPVDTDEDQKPLGGSVGELFERGIGWVRPPRPGVTAGADALAWAHFVPTPRLAMALLTGLTVDEAGRLRDATIHWMTLSGRADLLRREPLLALIGSMTVALVARADPRILEVPAPPS